MSGRARVVAEVRIRPELVSSPTRFETFFCTEIDVFEAFLKMRGYWRGQSPRQESTYALPWASIKAVTYRTAGCA